MASRGPGNQQPNRSGGGTAAGGATQGLRKPVFVKVDQLKPGTYGHTLTVKVMESNTVMNKKPRNPTSFRGPSLQQQRPTRIAECLVGDETGTILFTARNDQGTYDHFSPFLFSSPVPISLSFCEGKKNPIFFSSQTEKRVVVGRLISLLG